MCQGSQLQPFYSEESKQDVAATKDVELAVPDTVAEEDADDAPAPPPTRLERAKKFYFQNSFVCNACGRRVMSSSGRRDDPAL